MKHIARILTVLFAVILINPVSLVLSASAAEPEMRGVWVSTIYSLDYPKEKTTDSKALMEYADEILDNCKAMGINSVFLQVRPSSDAFYKSELFPWSKYLTGESGLAPEDGFDPLEYWVTKAHEKGIELHAWINPFRVAVNNGDFEAISEESPAKKSSGWVVKHSDGQYYFNPGIPEVREYIISGVVEILDYYAVDGIHLDDYFYPSGEFGDGEAFADYGSGYAEISDWRRDNINSLIENLYRVTGEKGRTFGVSVAGIWANSDKMEGGSETAGNQSYFSSCADSKKWVENNWIDYICPQIYWNIGHSLADYETLVKWWAETVSETDVSLYIGMADYQAGNEKPESPWYGIDEIKRQMNLNDQIHEIDGEIHFRYSFMQENSELSSYYSQVYGGEEIYVEPEPQWNTHKPYMSGSGGKFKPDGKLTRAEAAIIFARLMTDKDGISVFDENGNYSCSFSDVGEGAWYKTAIGFMEEYGIITGYSDGTYKPDKTITRGEFATLVARFEKEEPTDRESGFSDVSSEHWAAANITAAVKKGYISGYGDGSFMPEKEITRSECVKIMNKMLGREADTEFIDKYPGANVFSDVKAKHWAYYEIIEATYSHEYHYPENKEKWSEETVPMIPYESDKINFIIPELKMTDPLVPLDLSKIEGIALHHMAHATADFRTIESWHLNQGWRAFGYNFWVDFKGNVYVGRGWNVGAGVANKNSILISVGFQGDYEKTNKKMPTAQYNAGVELVKWIAEKVPSVSVVGGHKDFGATLCPGKYFPLEKMKKAAGF